MLIEKLKWLAFTFTTACLVVFAAGSGLVGQSRTGQKMPRRPYVQVKTEDRKVAVPIESGSTS